MTYQRFTLSEKRRDQVHAVKGARTLCGVHVAFAPDPRETHAEISCTGCLRKLPVEQRYGRLPLNDEDGARLLEAVRKLRALDRRRADEAASRAYMDVVKLVYGDYARIEPNGLELMDSAPESDDSTDGVDPLQGGVAAETDGTGIDPVGAESVFERARRLV